MRRTLVISYYKMLIYDIPEKRDPGPYEGSEFFEDPGKTQELDFHIMCFIWWNLQLKADLFFNVECG